MDRKKLLISGASVAAGAGLPDGHRNPVLWCNQLARELGYRIYNISTVGIDNLEIFQNTASAIMDGSYDLVLVQWQIIPCRNQSIGLETYNTLINLVGTRPLMDINLVAGQKFESKKLEKFRSLLMRYHKEHWEIKELVSYCKILSFIAEKSGSTIKFINFNMPWHTNRFFDKKLWRFPSELDGFTRTMLDADFRQDSEVRDLHDMIHDHYDSVGPMNLQNWLNLYDPLIDHQLDQISDSDLHPGIESQVIIKNKVSEWLIKHYNII